MKPAGPVEVAREDTQEALGAAMVDVVLASLLGAVPAPFVVASSDKGLCVPVPPDVPIAPEQVITGIGSLLELCMPADLEPVVEAWERARKTNGSQVAIHLRSDPDHAVILHFVDARHRYGVYLGIIVGKTGTANDQNPTPTLFRPRLCTMRRNELSIVLSIDAASSKILGWTDEELVGKRMTDIIHPDDRSLAIANWMSMLGSAGLRIGLSRATGTGRAIISGSRSRIRICSTIPPTAA